jgi:hypothetical protein
VLPFLDGKTEHAAEQKINTKKSGKCSAENQQQIEQNHLASRCMSGSPSTAPSLTQSQKW